MQALKTNLNKQINIWIGLLKRHPFREITITFQAKKKKKSKFQIRASEINSLNLRLKLWMNDSFVLLQDKSLPYPPLPKEKKNQLGRAWRPQILYLHWPCGLSTLQFYPATSGDPAVEVWWFPASAQTPTLAEQTQTQREQEQVEHTRRKAWKLVVNKAASEITYCAGN